MATNVPRISGEFFDTGNRRSRFQMCIEILDTVNAENLRLTHIMYRANVNCSELKKFIDYLMECNLLTEVLVGRNRVVYHLTPEGREALALFKRLNTEFFQPKSQKKFNGNGKLS